MRHLSLIARGLGLAALLALYASTLLGLGHVAAQARPDGRLVELVARVSFNEALDSRADLGLIWQITEGHSETTSGRVAWLERHSPCVSGRLSLEAAQARPGNCRWSRHLGTTARTPRGWPWRLGIWRRLAPRWLAHVERARALVRGRDPWRPCAELPDSWDGARWRERIEARGHEVLDCSVPYVIGPDAEGLHNLAIRWRR